MGGEGGGGVYHFSLDVTFKREGEGESARPRSPWHGCRFALLLRFWQACFGVNLLFLALGQM